MKRIWAVVRRWIREKFRHRITLAGFLFSLATSLVGAAAFLSANNLLFLMLATMLSTLLVAGFISKLSLAGLEVDFVVPDHVSARRKIRARIRVRNQKRWMSSFSIHLAGSPETGLAHNLYFPSIPGGATVEEPVEVCFQRRGVYKGSSFRFSTRFPFGFAERRVDVTLGGELLVYPALAPHPAFERLVNRITGEIEQHFRGRSHDFYRIRPYEAGESARHVDWRATAHTGSLQVREFAREQEHLVELFFDLNVTYDQLEWFERAIECVAYFAWRISERGARMHMRTQNFDHRLPEECDIFTVLKYLALAEPLPGASILEPVGAGAYRIVVTPDPERATWSGWLNAHIISTQELGEFPALPGRYA